VAKQCLSVCTETGLPIPAPLVAHGAAGRCAAPVGSLEEADEVGFQGVLRLTDLPILAAVAFQILAEAAHPVCERLVGGGTGEELADPADEVGCGARSSQLGPEQELTELLERGLGLAHGAPSPTGSNRRATRTPFSQAAVWEGLRRQ